VVFEQLKEKQSVMWGSGPFERIEAVITELHDSLVERLGPRPGERWLDIGCGTGAVAMQAARAGADVTGVDLAPELIETAKRRAEEEGLDIEYEVGDCEDMRFDDGSFDVVASAVGFSFAPDHRATASELARVTRPGGRLGFVAWSPDGGIGELFRVMAPYSPPPPEGAGRMVDWGREDYVRELLGEVFDLRFEERDAPWEIGSGEEAWQLFLDSYGPTKAVAGALDPDRREQLHREFVALHENNPVDGAFSFSRTYLLVVGTLR
jgi:SAM-dependent methyltransferase